MPKPKSVLIGPHKYTVVYENEICANDDLCGFIKHEQTKIVIDDGMSTSYQKETLLHECLHGLFQLTGLRKAAVVNEGKEEIIVNAIAPALLDMLRRNKTLLTYLLENDG